MLFSDSVQPGLVSLYSSTGTDPLYLWSSHSDPTLPSDSFIVHLDDATSLPAPSPPKTLISPPSLDPPSNDTDLERGATRLGYELTQLVLHIQSPSLRTTYIRCPPEAWSMAQVSSSIARITGAGGRSARKGDLGLRQPWMFVQVRNLAREWSFEIGLVDQGGKEGVVRCSTFQQEPKLTLRANHPPLLHLPFSFPTMAQTTLTPWSTVSLNLPSLLPHFSSAVLLNRGNDSSDEDDEDVHDDRGPLMAPIGSMPLPSSAFSHVSYVKFYATCRLRRVWFSEGGPGQKLPWEFELYGTN